MKSFKNIQRIFTKQTRTIAIVILVLFCIGGGLFFFTRTTEAAWYNDSWAYRVKITFGNTGAAVSNQKVKLDIDTATLITAGKMQADCGDSRFTDTNGIILQYYLDESGGACNSASTDYYVLIPTIGVGTTTLYHYYGNPSADNGTEIAQFSGSTFAPTSGPSEASEEAGPAPVAYLKFDEAQGATAYDSSPSQNDGTISGASWYNELTCFLDSCLRFDGDDDVVTITNATSIDFDTGLKNGMTMSFWMKGLTDGQSDAGEVVYKGSATYVRTTNQGSDGYMDLSISLNLATTDATVSVTDAIKVSTWHHISIGYTDDGDDEITVYVDGVLKATSANGSGSPATDTNDLLLGGNSSNNYHGFIDEFKMYPYERTASQIYTDVIQRGSIKGVSAQFGKDDIQKRLTDGLIGYWDLDENTANTCTGGVNDACDSSGYGADGEWFADTTTTPGKFGSGATFDGDLDVIAIGDQATHDLQFPFSLSIWMNLDQLPSDWGQGAMRLMSKYDSSPNRQWTFFLEGTNEIQFFKSHNGTNGSYGLTWSYSVTAADVGVWRHLVFTADANGVTNLYKDGVRVDGTTFSNLTIYTGGSANLGIGAARGGSTFDEFQGDLDEARIYNRVLSPAEVSDLYNWAPGPTHHYALDENTGTSTVNDTSGNNKSGTMNNFASSAWVPGKMGNALSFDGSSSYISVGTPELPTGDFSYEAWVNVDDNTDETVFNALDGSGGDELGIRILTQTSNGRISVITNGSQRLATTRTVPLNTWTHIGVVRSGSSLNVYVNGVLDDQTGADGTAMSFSSCDLLLGVDADTTCTSSLGNYFDGKMDDIKIYNYARTPAQIIEDMNGGHPVGGSPVGSQTAYWKLDDMSGTTAQDSSMNNLDLTLSTASWTASGKFDGAWNGAGTNWLSISDNASLDIGASAPVSISMWAKSDSSSNPAASQFLATKQTATDNPGYRMYFNTSGQIVCDIDDDTSSYPEDSATTSTDYYDNAWHNIICIRDIAADALTIYVDGVQAAQDTDLSAIGDLSNSSTFYLGDDDGDATNSFAGDIDEVKFYRAALTTDQVKTEFNHGKSQVMGSLSTNSSGVGQYGSNWAYCPPGSASSCTGPVGEWKFDTGSGTSAFDTSGNAYTGSLSTPTWTNGKFANALLFNGSGDIVTLPSTIYSSAATSGAVSFWIKPQSTGAIQGVISLGNQDANGLKVLINSDGTVNCQFQSSVDNDSLQSNTALTYGEWSYVAVTWDGTTGSVYINGRLDNSSTGIGFQQDASTSNKRFGTPANRTFELKGVLDQVRMYDYVRTPAQVTWEYNQGAPLAWYKFDECQGTTINDWAPNANRGFNGNTGTLSIGATGTNDAPGTCSSGDSTEAWNNGTTGKINSSLDFDGTDDYVTISDDDVFTFGNGTTDRPFSIAAWINTDDATQNAIVAKYDETSASEAREFILYLSSSDFLTLEVFDETAGGNISRRWATAFPENEWHHVVATYDGSGTQGGIKIFVDGKQRDDTDVSSGTFNAIQNTTGAVEIGANTGTGGTATYLFDGQVDDVRIFNYALTTQQINTVINNGAVSFK